MDVLRGKINVGECVRPPQEGKPPVMTGERGQRMDHSLFYADQTG